MGIFSEVLQLHHVDPFSGWRPSIFSHVFTQCVQEWNEQIAKRTNWRRFIATLGLRTCKQTAPKCFNETSLSQPTQVLQLKSLWASDCQPRAVLYKKVCRSSWQALDPKVMASRAAGSGGWKQMPYQIPPADWLTVGSWK